MNITDPIYSDANKAREHLEALHWPEGPVCPHCGCMGRITKLAGKSTRPGVHKCNDCEKPFTVTVGTIMEDSKIPLNKWLMAFALMSGSKKGISAHQLHRSLGITYKSAWFLAHRIREAMKSDDITPLGGEGKTVEVDETFIGGKEKNRHKSKRANRNMGGSWGKETVFALVERDGRVRSMHVASVTAANLRPIMVEQINAASMLCTDDAGQYRHMGRDFTHELVTTARKSMSVETPIRTPWRAISRSSSAGSMAAISTSARPICIAILRNSTSATAIALPLA
jgi:transposase-like protein